MIPRILLLALAFCVFAIAGCGSGQPGPSDTQQLSPSDAFVIPESEHAAVEAAAEQGDVAAMKKLIAHYDALSGTDELAERWKAAAREAGDSEQLNYYASGLLVAAGRESDPAKRRAMLADALASAKRSNEGKANRSAQKIILELTRAVEAEQ